MRNSTRALAVAAAIATPVVIGGSATAAKPPATCKAVPKAGIAYTVRGTVVADATGFSLVVRVTGGNAAGKKAMPALGAYDAGVPISIAPCTKVSRLDAKGKERKQTRFALKEGDRVLVTWKAKRGKVLSNLGAAQRIVELRKR